MSLFSRRVDVVVVALSWNRTVVIEQGRWRSRRTSWKPHGDNVRNLHAVKVTEVETMSNAPRGGGSSRDTPWRGSSAVVAKNTYFEYEELEWRKYRSFSARGEGQADVRWPEYALGPDQRISERREVYRATFATSAGDGADEYVTELDEATWRTLEKGLKCRLTMSAFSDEVQQVTPVLG